MRRSEDFPWLFVDNISSVTSPSVNISTENRLFGSKYPFCQNLTLENNPILINPSSQIHSYASHQYNSQIHASPKYEIQHSQIPCYQTVQTHHYQQPSQLYFTAPENHFNFPKPTLQNPAYSDFLAEITPRCRVNPSFNGADANIDEILETFSNLNLAHNYQPSPLMNDLWNLTSKYNVGSLPLMSSTVGSSSSYRNRLSTRNLVAAKSTSNRNYSRQHHSEWEQMREEEVDMIIDGLKDQLAELMKNQSSGHLIQRLFESSNQKQISKMLSLLASSQKLLEICFQEHGSRAVQKMIKHLEEPEQKALLVSMLKPITLQLSKENGGHAYHVILECMEQFLPEETEPVQEEIAGDCLDLAINKNGCCLLQQCMPYTTVQIKERIIGVIMANALPLSEHPFGNYVVQFVVKMRIPYATSSIIGKLRGRFVSLCMNKYASHVVEKCLHPDDVGDDHSRWVMSEICDTPDFLKVLQDRYGNYVMQVALRICKGDVFRRLLSLIQINHPFLHSHPYGKKVLAKAKEQMHRTYTM